MLYFRPLLLGAVVQFFSPAVAQGPAAVRRYLNASSIVTSLSDDNPSSASVSSLLTSSDGDRIVSARPSSVLPDTEPRRTLTVYTTATSDGTTSPRSTATVGESYSGWLTNSSASDLTTSYSNTTTSLSVSLTSATVTSCVSPGIDVTRYHTVPNTTTVTLTGDQTYSYLQEFTPPITCGATSSAAGINPFKTQSNSLPQGVPTLSVNHPTFTTTVIVTQKNAPTTRIDASVPSYPDLNSLRTNKLSVSTPTTKPVSDISWGSGLGPGATNGPIDGGNSGSSGDVLEPNGGGSSTGGKGTTTVTAGGVRIVVGPALVIIDGQSVAVPNTGSSVLSIDGQTFTISPLEVVAPGTTIPIPTQLGAIFMPTPTPISTVISGISVLLGPSEAVISGITFSIGAGAPETSFVVNHQTISIGPEGLGFPSTTIAPVPSEPTNVVIIGGEPFSVVGSSIAVIAGATFTYGSGIPIQTDVLNGQTITIDPSGVDLPQTRLGGSTNVGLQIGIAGGLSITEIGATIAVISATILTVGPRATTTTAVISGHTITAGPIGLDLGSTTLSYPFNPITSMVTAGGIIFTQIGSSLVVIGGSTFTIGPGAQITTDIYEGQTISIGPSGVGFNTTTFMPSTATSAPAGKNKNSAERQEPTFGILGVCIALGVGYLI